MQAVQLINGYKYTVTQAQNHQQRPHHHYVHVRHSINTAKE